MRDSFPGHYFSTEPELRAIWRDCTISPDANVLLNLYRYRPSVRKKIVKVLSSIQDRLFLTFQAAKEFQENRLEVISNSLSAFDILAAKSGRFKEDVTKFLDEMAPRHPRLGQKVIRQRILRRIEQLEAYIESERKEVPDRRRRDEIRVDIDRIFVKSLGKPFTEKELAEIYREGERRFEERRPPGYEDKKKGETRQFGDLVLWKELLRQGRTTKKPIILITDDRKEDWWLISRGEILGPRPELIAEMRQEAGVAFHMYSAAQFIQHAQSFTDTHVSPETVKEIQEANKQPTVPAPRLSLEDLSKAQTEQFRKLRESLTGTLELQNALNGMLGRPNTLANLVVQGSVPSTEQRLRAQALSELLGTGPGNPLSMPDYAALASPRSESILMQVMNEQKLASSTLGAPEGPKAERPEEPSMKPDPSSGE